MRTFFLILAFACTSTHAISSSSKYWSDKESYPHITSELGFSNNLNVTENTLDAFTKGIERGATSIEFTSRRSLDGKVALIHNDVVENDAGEKIIVELTNFSELPEGTLELDDALKFVVDQDIGFNIMMQNNPVEEGYDPSNKIAEEVVQRIMDAGLSHRALVTAFDAPTVGAASFTCEEDEDCDAMFGWLVMKLNPVRRMTPEDYYDVLVKYNLDALIPEGELVLSTDTALLDAFVNTYDMPVFVWWMGVGTASREKIQDLKLLACKGVGGFITPRVPMAVLAKKINPNDDC